MKILFTHAGFTLTELLIASALSSIILLFGSSFLISSQKADLNMTQHLDITFSTVQTAKMMRKELYLAGGPYLHPWNAIAVENNCAASPPWFPACGGSDRITVANEIVDPNTNTFGSAYKITSYEPSGVITIDTSLGCPLVAALANKHFIITDPTDLEVYARWVTAVNITTCQLSTTNDRQGAILNTPNAAVANYVGGIATMVVLKTIYLDTANKLLRRLTKNNNLIPLSAGELTTIAVDVFDLQLALGYDVDLRDGNVEGSSSSTYAAVSTADEVLYNHPSDTLALMKGIGANKRDLKMVLVAVTRGTTLMKTVLYGNSQKFFDGPNISSPAHYLFGFEKRFYLRNVLEFQ